MADDEAGYANIRQILGGYIGRRILEITQHDPEEWAENGLAYILLLFDDGSWIKMFVGDEGFANGDGSEDPG